MRRRKLALYRRKRIWRMARLLSEVGDNHVRVVYSGAVRAGMTYREAP